MWLALAKGSWSRLLRDLIYSLSRWFCFPKEKAPQGLLPDRGPNYWEIYQCLCCLQLWRLLDLGPKQRSQRLSPEVVDSTAGNFELVDPAIVASCARYAIWCSSSQNEPRTSQELCWTEHTLWHITILPLKIIKHLKEQIIGIPVYPVYPVYIHSTSVWLYSRFIIINIGEKRWKVIEEYKTPATQSSKKTLKKTFCM